MQAFTQLKGIVAPLDRANIDTDAIIPKQYLKSIERTGFGPNLFDDWRYLDSGEPGQSIDGRLLNPDFILNKSRYAGAQILLARENFGCGSSREHAVWALLDYGIRVIIAPSYADIFYNNCFNNGLLPIVLQEEIVDSLFIDVEERVGYTLEVNLEQQRIVTPEGKGIAFSIETFRRYRLLNGLDDIGLTLQYADEIKAFEENYRQQRPWLFNETYVEPKILS